MKKFIIVGIIYSIFVISSTLSQNYNLKFAPTYPFFNEFIHQGNIKSRNYILYKHPQDGTTSCLDGTPASLYISKGSSSKIVLYFQGGSYCMGKTKDQLLESCLQYANSIYGSSSSYSSTFDFSKYGILSNDPKINPLFYSWTKIYIPYCDGSGHQGYKKDPLVHSSGKKLYLRGENNTMAHLNYLNKQYKLFDAQKLLITGYSSGAIAALHWTNNIYAKMKNKRGVTVISDGGVLPADFVNSITNSAILEPYMTQLLAISNTETKFPMKQCEKKYPNALTNCFKVTNFIEFIKPPVFAIQSLYDSWGLRNLALIMNSNCIPQPPVGYTTPVSFQKCSVAEKALIQKFKQAQQVQMRGVAKYPKNGVWAISCSQHFFNLAMGEIMTSSAFRVNKRTIAQSINEFLHGRNKINIDTAIWPNNQGCNGICPANCQTCTYGICSKCKSNYILLPINSCRQMKKNTN